MLGEITHLQGIIDDLVVLTAEPHKLPPASEQVRPPLESRAETRTREETVLPSCRERVDKRGRCLGEALGRRRPETVPQPLGDFWEYLPR